METIRKGTKIHLNEAPDDVPIDTVGEVMEVCREDNWFIVMFNTVHGPIHTMFPLDGPTWDGTGTFKREVGQDSPDEDISWVLAFGE